uniref:Uncharacterized protein n=1 Tax=Naja naja TaxID=35670 RepID=A0A8C6XRF9_NAJNA
MASEGDLGRKWDRCLADSAVKLGEGAAFRGEGAAGGGDAWAWDEAGLTHFSLVLQWGSLSQAPSPWLALHAFNNAF